MTKFTPEFICKQRKIMALATPGPWDGNTDWNYRHKKIYSSDKEDKAVLAFHGIEAWVEGPITLGETLSDVEQQVRADVLAMSTAVDNYPAALNEIKHLQVENLKLRTEVKKHRMIPVTERMPDHMVRVLIKMTNNYVVCACYNYLRDEWKNDSGSVIQSENVVSWMHLPESEVDGC